MHIWFYSRMYIIHTAQFHGRVLIPRPMEHTFWTLDKPTFCNQYITKINITKLSNCREKRRIKK